MKKQLLFALLFLTNCEKTSISVKQKTPYIVHKYEDSIVLHYEKDSIIPKNLKSFINLLKQNRRPGRTTKHLMTPHCAENLCEERLDYLDQHLKKSALYDVKFRKNSEDMLKNQQSLKVKITSYEARLGIAKTDFGYAYHANILQNMSDISSLFNERKPPIQIDSKLSTAAINAFYEENNVKESTQNNEGSDETEDLSSSLTNSLLSSIKGG